MSGNPKYTFGCKFLVILLVVHLVKIYSSKGILCPLFSSPPSVGSQFHCSQAAAGKGGNVVEGKAVRG